MIKSVRIIGIGGQGVIKAGIILAKAIFLKGLNVVQTQTYGAEVRGGAVNADIIFVTEKGEEIYDLNIGSFDFFLIMANRGLERHESFLKDNTIVIFPQSLVPEIKFSDHPSIKKYVILDKEILRQLEGPFSLNMSYLGAFAKIYSDLEIELLKKTIKSESREKYLKDNLKALELGFSNIRELF
ncbi:MAG: 2-oxoacid:acceptor oxidoreductase family protein [Candidatus Helarchaeota archaeon]